MLRSRKSRREEPLDPIDAAAAGYEQGPEQEAMLADSVGLALLVVLDTLPPAERVAFVLHDTFGLPFGEIASITGRSPAAARQLASRGRRRIQGADPAADPAAGERLARQRRVTEAFIAASRGGDLEGLIAVLDPDVVLHSDAVASPSGVALTVRGAAAVAGGARAASARARYGSIALVNGAPGLIMAPRGRLMIALALTFSGDKISQIDVVADPDRLAQLDLGLLD
jgi:RNA polymerase sigma-70 factor (ECF subfamily)